MSELLSEPCRLPYSLELRPSSEFSAEGGMKRLISISHSFDNETQMAFITPANENGLYSHHDSEEGCINRWGKTLRLATKIDIESYVSIGCAGAVLTYLQRRRAVDYLPGDVAACSLFRVATIATFVINDIMLVITAVPKRPLRLSLIKI